MAGELTIEVNTDGTVSIRHPGGGFQTTASGGNTEEAIKSLKAAYGNRIGAVVQSNKTGSQVAEEQKSVRDTLRNAAVERTSQGVGIGGDQAANTGFDTSDIQRYINSDANKLGPKYQSVDQFVSDSASQGRKALANVLPADQIQNLTTKQLLAAAELYFQGNGDTGRSNGISEKDLDFVLNKANDFRGAVISPNQQAISTGFDQTIQQKKSQAPGVISPPSDRVAPTTPGSAIGNTGLSQPVNPTPVEAVPQVVTTQVSRPTYQNIPSNVSMDYDPDTGTFRVPLQTAGLSAVPQSVTHKTHYAGTVGLVDPTITAESQGTAGVRTVPYTNDFGQQVMVTESNGQPMTFVPPGYTRAGEQGSAPQPQQSTASRSLSSSGPSLGQGSSQGKPFGGGRGTGNTPYTGSMSGGPMSGNPQASRPSLSQLSTDQELVVGPDGWYVRPYTEPQGFAGIPQAAGAIAGAMMGNMFNQGGSVENDAELDAMFRMATKFLGYRGPRSRKSLEDFAKSSPGAAAKMKSYTAAMAKGGMVRKGYQAGGQVTENDLADMSGNLVRQTLQPVQAPFAMIQPEAADFIPVDAGQTVPLAPFAESATVATSAQAGMPQFMTPASFQAQQAAPQVAEETARLQAAQGQVSQQAQVQAAQQQGTAVSSIEAAQGTAILMDNPMQREIQDGELISGTSVDATKVAELNSQLQAAQATPTAQATVQGQLEGLMTQFEGGQTPAWAAGAMRNATAMLAARGLGASSLAGQAVIQATMESALPIAMADAQTRAQFEAQNLSNRQQTAMMAAQQRAAFLQLEFDQEFQSRVQNSARIADIANMNFTAEQQIALENSRIANTTNLQNLNNRQAMVMAEAASLANLDMANLNNRQQAAVQNAQNFLQMDLTNLNNEQQTGLFRAQQNIQALFTDQAAENAAGQFNAASENQTNQFFSNLNAQVSQFNATQQNAMDQFNINSVNAMRQFNSEIQQQRDLFNAQNGLVIAQANAQWRQNIATLNNATQNQSNMDFAKTINALTSTNLDQIWQRERDIMNYAFTQSETSMDRALSLLLADKELDAYRDKMAADQEDSRAALATSVILEWVKK